MSETSLFCWIILSVPLFCSCARNLYHPIVDTQSALDKKSSQVLSLTKQEKMLLDYVQDSQEKRSAVKDILLGLEAEEAEARGDWETAASRWLSVLLENQTNFGERAFQGWVRSYVQTQNEDVGIEKVVDVLKSLTHQGTQSPWIVKNKLVVSNKLEAKVSRILKVKQGGSDESIRPPASKDPDVVVLYEVFQKVCADELNDEWKLWSEALPKGAKEFWYGLLSQCKGNYEEARTHFVNAELNLEVDVKKQRILLAVFDQLIHVQKRLSMRDEVAATYLKQSLLLNRMMADGKDQKRVDYDLMKKSSEVLLWVARTQALKGNYTLAKVSINKSLDLLQRLEGAESVAKKVVVDLRLDSYFTYATRILYEEKDYDDALKFIRLANLIEQKDQEWIERLNWAEGWLNFKKRDFVAAVSVWEGSLKVVKSDVQKARTLFWLGRSYLSIGENSIAKEKFDRLMEEFPLSFYSIVGLPKVSFGRNLRDRWPQNVELKKSYEAIGSFSAPVLSSDKDFLVRLIRLEACIYSSAKGWIPQVSSDLFRYVSSKSSLFDDKETILYLSRLLAAGGEYQMSMALLNQLSLRSKEIWQEFPEYLFTYFPAPYLSFYEEAASKSGIEVELPLAISRQESSFDAAATSPAEAFGLMQLIIPTAQKQAGLSGVSGSVNSDLLKDPSKNIMLGTGYLASLGRHYGGKWHYAFAAYNAGEYVVDAWVSRRSERDALEWVEGISFGETLGYVRNVWRNWEIYKYLFYPSVKNGA